MYKTIEILLSKHKATTTCQKDYRALVRELCELLEPRVGKHTPIEERLPTISSSLICSNKAQELCTECKVGTLHINKFTRLVCDNCNAELGEYD